MVRTGRGHPEDQSGTEGGMAVYYESVVPLWHFDSGVNQGCNK